MRRFRSGARVREQRDLDTSVKQISLGLGGGGADCRAHCVAFCSAVARQHTSECRDVFPAVAAHVPLLVASYRNSSTTTTWSPRSSGRSNR